MGLDDFTSDTLGGNISGGGHTNGGETPRYTREELISEIKRFKRENGKVTRKLFDESDGFPSSNPIRREFGSWNEGLKAAIGDVNIEQTDSVSEWEAYLDVLKGASKYGKNLTVKDVLDDSQLMSRNAIENATDMKFNEVKKHLGLAVNQEKNIPKQRVINELEEIEYPLKVNKVNKKCSFSHKVVSKYGDGSYTRGLENLGFSTNDIQSITSNYKSDYSERARVMLDNLDSYDSDNSSYVYVLKLVTNDGSDWFYVGKVNNNSSMHRRLSSHLRQEGDFSRDLDVKDITLHELNKVDSNILSNKEREISFRIAIDENTTNVLGGK